MLNEEGVDQEEEKELRSLEGWGSAAGDESLEWSASEPDDEPVDV
jgi:hypothetical protein